LLHNGTGIFTGAQREHRLDVVESQEKNNGMKLENLPHYLDFFRHCIPPLGGLGLGFARVMLKMLDQFSIRETTL